MLPGFAATRLPARVGRREGSCLEAKSAVSVQRGGGFNSISHMVAALAAGVVSFPLSDRCSYAHRSWHRFVLAGSIHARP